MGNKRKEFKLKKKKRANCESLKYARDIKKLKMSHVDELSENVTNTNSSQVNNREEIERDTVLQAESAMWLELRRCLLTASMFSKVCKRREGTSSAPLVKNLLYSYSLQNVPSIKHGKLNESRAIEQLQRQENIVIRKCGLFVDDTLFYLGASPDGLCNEGIVEIKCPSSAFNIHPEDAIQQRKIKFWQRDGTINVKHDWYYQIQGQLHITNKKECIFAVWTGELTFKG